jgi:hypothetical protein
MGNGRTDSTGKSAVIVEAGRRGALRRWGPGPRAVRLDEFDADERTAILAAIDARRAAKAARHDKAPEEIQSPSEAELEGHAHDRPAA